MSRSFVAIFLIASALGCTSVAIRPIASGESLRATEGLLVLQIRTDRALQSISISGVSFPLDIRPGTHLQLIAVSPGYHRWSGVGVPATVSDARGTRSTTLEFSFANLAELRFRVEAGSINYPGTLEIYDGAWRVGTRLVDRTAVAMEELSEKFPAMVAKYPIVYSGPARHVFLERYRAAKSARKPVSAPESETAR